MKFTYISLLPAGLLAFAALSSNLSATALPAPLSDIDFSAHGAVKEEYNSNVLSSAGNNTGAPTKFDDYIATFTPGLTLVYGGIPDTKVTLDYTETFLRYFEHPSLNEELSNVALSATRKQGAFDLSAGVSFVQNYSNTPSTTPGATSILRSDVIDARGNVTWNYSDKFNFSTGLEYNKVAYLYSQGQSSQNSETYTLPLSGYYVYTNEVSIGAGYSYSQTDTKNSIAPVTPGRSRYTNTFTVNTRLTSWNKLSGTANVGIGVNHINAGGGSPAADTTSVNYGVDMDYAYSDIVSFNFSGARNFSTGAAGQNIESTSAGLGATYKYSANLNVRANVITFNHSEYLQTARKDDAKTSGITVTWTPYTYLTLTAAYSYFMNSSNAPGSTYNINIASISAAVSY